MTAGAAAVGERLDGLLRAFMSGFPTGVAVVTTVDATGAPRGTTCSSLVSVTMAPPTLLVCLDLRSATLAALVERGGFAVNLLHAGGRSTAEAFASRDPYRFARVRWRPTPDFGLPWLVEAAGALAQCVVTDVRPVGDHAVVFGEVRAVGGDTGQAPLLYGRRRYAAWPVGETA
jgi:flavin reductase (DIM6/NTAB) family NADH-FMN oxidoreductase RutF